MAHGCCAPSCSGKIAGRISPSCRICGRLNPSLRALLQSADAEARRQPGSAEADRQTRDGLPREPVSRAGCARLSNCRAPGSPTTLNGCMVRLSSRRKTATKRSGSDSCEQTLRLKPDNVPALLKLADGFFKLDRLDEAAHYYETGRPGAWQAAHLCKPISDSAASRRAARTGSKVIEYAAPLARDLSVCAAAPPVAPRSLRSHWKGRTGRRGARQPPVRQIHRRAAARKIL